MTKKHDSIIAFFSILYALPILVGYFIVLGVERIYTSFAVALFIFAMISGVIVGCCLVCRYIRSGSAVSRLIGIYLFAVLIIAATVNIISPAMGWDFFGEYNFEGHAHAALRAIGVDASRGVDLLRNAVDRHPPFIMSYLGGVSVVSGRYLSGHGYFFQWMVVYAISGAVIFLTASLKKNNPRVHPAFITAVFFSVPLISTHGIYGGYLEIWTVCGVLLMQYLIASLILAPNDAVLRSTCFFVVGIATFFSRATAYIFILVIFISFLLSLLQYYLEDKRKSEVSVKSRSIFIGVIALSCVACAALYIGDSGYEALKISVAGKVLSVAPTAVSDVFFNEFHALFMLSSFSLIPLMWLVACMWMSTQNSFFNSRKERLILRFSTWSVVVTWMLLMLFQFTDYGAAISQVGSDTGMSRLHIVLVAMQLFSIASIFALTDSHLGVSRPR